MQPPFSRDRPYNVVSAGLNRGLCMPKPGFMHPGGLHKKSVHLHNRLPSARIGLGPGSGATPKGAKAPQPKLRSEGHSSCFRGEERGLAARLSRSRFSLSGLGAQHY